MKTRSKFLVMVAVLGLGLMFSVVPTSAAVSTPSTTDWVTVTKVMVNKLGGVNVSGRVSCAGTYQQIAAGNFYVQVGQDQDGNPIMEPLVLQPGDTVNMIANNDNYTVSQPAGRKTMIQVTHGSSRMNPCFVQYPSQPDGTPMPPVCSADGTSCAWETDNFGYDRAILGPLFDYSPNGMFKPGDMSVFETSVGLDIMVHHSDGSWAGYYVEEGSFSMTSRTIKAVSYR